MVVCAVCSVHFPPGLWKPNSKFCGPDFPLLVLKLQLPQKPLEGVWKHRCPPRGVPIRWVWAGPEDVHLQQVPRCHHGCGPSGHGLRRVSWLRLTAPPCPGQLCRHLRLVPAPRLPGARVLLDGLERRCPSAAVAFATCAVPCDQLQGASFCHPGFTQPEEVKLPPGAQTGK